MPSHVLADLLLVPLELGGGAVVEVAQGDLDAHLDVVAAGLVRRLAKVAVAAKEAAEQVEGVVSLAAAAAAALLVLLDAIVAIAVVDLARLGVGEHFVGFGHFDKLFVRSFVAPKRRRLSGHGQSIGAQQR